MPRHMCRRPSVTPSQHSRRSTVYESEESDSEFEYPIRPPMGASHSMMDTAIQLALRLFKKSSAPKKGRPCCVVEDEDDDPSRYRAAMDYSNGCLKCEFAVPLFSSIAAPKPKPKPKPRFRETVYIGDCDSRRSVSRGRYPRRQTVKYVEEDVHVVARAPSRASRSRYSETTSSYSRSSSRGRRVR